MTLLDIFWRKRLRLSFEQRFLPSLHHFGDFVDVGLHFLNEAFNVKHYIHASSDEWIDISSVPSKFTDTWLKRIVHLSNPVLKKRLLYRK